MTEQTLRTAMAEYGDTVYRLALCRTQSIPDAEDVYQDCLLYTSVVKKWGVKPADSAAV